MNPQLAGTLAFFALVVAGCEWLRRGLRVAPDVTRKLYLAGLAAGTIPTAFWVGDRDTAVSLYLGLAALAYFSFRFEWLAAVEDDGPRLGSVYFPLSCAFLFAWFWGERVYIAVGAALAAGIGDGVAAFVGQRFGTRKYRPLGTTRSMEGTLSMFFAAGVTLAPVLATAGELGWHQAVAFGLIAATVAACVESVSPYSTDNATVPLVTAATLTALTRFSQ